LACIPSTNQQHSAQPAKIAVARAFLPLTARASDARQVGISKRHADRDRVGLLNFNNSKAPYAFDAKQVPGISDWRLCWIGSHGFPAARGSARTLSRHSGGGDASGAGALFHGSPAPLRG
jgi:hypothetical protein